MNATLVGKKSRHSFQCGLGAFAKTLALVSCAILSACAVPSIVSPHPTADWSPLFTPADVALVQQTFPLFVPALYAPGYQSGQTLSADNFAPAEFFGPANPQGFQSTPGGILIETNGYDGEQMPPHFPPTGTYFDQSGNPYQINLTTFTRSPENILQKYMGISLTPNAPTIQLDLTMGRVDLNYVDQFMTTLQSQLALALPAIQKVDPTSCEIIIEPSILYVGNGSYAGGVTEDIGGGKWRSHVSAFYVKSPQAITNWSDFLIDEGLNCFVAAAGRPDLEH